MSDREDARRAWREAVNEAARETQAAMKRIRAANARFVSGERTWDLVNEADITLYARVKARNALRSALSAPKPWRSSRKPDPRRRYSRAHRRECGKCRWARGGDGYRFFPIAEWAMWGRDPHGRRA